MRRKIKHASLAGLCLLLASAAPAWAQPKKEYLYVENTYGDTVSIFSIPEHKLVGTIPSAVVGKRPDDVAATPDGSMIFINRQATEDVVAIDTRTEKALFTVPVKGEPHHMTISHDGRYLYVPIFNYNNVTVIDIAQRKVARTIPVGAGPHATRLSPDGRRLYVGHIVGENITVVDLATSKVVRSYQFERGVRPFEIAPDEKTMYVQLSYMDGFHEVDMATGNIRRTMRMPTPWKYEKLSFPFSVDHGLGISPDGKYLLAAGTVTGRIAIFSHPDMMVLRDYEVGGEPNWITFNHDGRFAYVTSREKDFITVISMEDLSIVAKMKAGRAPQRMKAVYADRQVK